MGDVWRLRLNLRGVRANFGPRTKDLAGWTELLGIGELLALGMGAPPSPVAGREIELAVVETGRTFMYPDCSGRASVRQWSGRMNEDALPS